MGKIGIFRCTRARSKGHAALRRRRQASFKVAHLYQFQGKDTVEVDELLPGDIGAIAKVEEIEFDCVLHDSHDEDHIHLVPSIFPSDGRSGRGNQKKGDEQRLFDILGKLAMEDPTFVVERHPTAKPSSAASAKSTSSPS